VRSLLVSNEQRMILSAVCLFLFSDDTFSSYIAQYYIIVSGVADPECI